MENILRHSLTYAFLLVVMLSVPTMALAGPKEKVQVTEKKKTTCEYFKRKDVWRKARRSRIRDKKKKSKRSAFVVNNFKKAAKEACGSLVPPKAVDGLNKIPSLSNIVAGKLSFFNRAVSGTPPTLTEISELESIKNLFWIEGLIDRFVAFNPTPDDCNQFFGGNSDGESAGQAGCFLTQETARALEGMLSSSASICYFRSIPTVSLGQGVTILSGEENLPEGDFTKIFSSSNILVEMRVTGFPGEQGEGQGEEQEEEESEPEQSGNQRIFFKSDSPKELSKKQQYAYQVYFCNGEGSALSGYERTTISRAGKVDIFTEGDERQFSYQNIISGYLGKSTDGSNSVVFNTLLPRTFSLQNIESDGSFQQRASLTIDANNIMRNKSYNIDRFDDDETSIRRAYSVNQFTGTKAANIQFYQGAYKDDKPGNPGEGFNTAVEYRDNKYVHAPGSELESELDEVNLTTDSFYQPPSINFDSSRFNCNSTADVVIELDFSSDALLTILSDCESDSITNMDFCFEDSSVRQAEELFFSLCQ